ncbi:MAG TPA: hypothetical protein VFQ92_01745 [Blastocatellia bacterium]|nr:hypothetical protein [Blastocatellia bacterium]
MKRNAFVSICFVAVIVFALVAVALSQGNANSGRKSIEGSWRVLVTSDPPPPGAPPPPPPFDELITFTSNGGLVETNTVFRPSEATPGHGSWQFAANRTYNLTFIKFLFDGQGQFNGHLKVRGQIRLENNGNEWSGTGVVDFFDPAGNFLFSAGTVRVEATRLPVEPI